MDMEYNDILQALYDVWERVKEAMKKFAERSDYRCHRDFYVRTEYTYIPIFRRNMPYHRRNF